jgi:hypothetical protein
MRPLAPWILLAGIAAVGCRSERIPPPPPDGARLFADLEAQVRCGPRTPNSTGAACARTFILGEFGRHAARVAVQEFAVADPYGGDSLRLTNLMAHFRPEIAARVLIGAHWDSRPWADRDTGSARDHAVPAANDGASGIAVLLELGRILATWNPGVGVDLVCFDGEDYGREGDLDHYLLGSKHFVRRLGAYRPRAMILLDMVGERGARFPIEGSSLAGAPALARLVHAVAESLGVERFVPDRGPTLLDDHVPFLRAGIPAVDIIDIDYPEWHTTRDLPDRCDPTTLADVTRVVLHVLARLGRGE